MTLKNANIVSSNIQSMFYCKLAARVVWNRWDCNNKADVEAINCFFWRRLVVPGLKKSTPNGCFTLNLAQRKQHICNLSTSRHYMYMYVVCIYIYIHAYILLCYKSTNMSCMTCTYLLHMFSCLINLDVYCWISIMCRPAYPALYKESTYDHARTMRWWFSDSVCLRRAKSLRMRRSRRSRSRCRNWDDIGNLGEISVLETHNTKISFLEHASCGI